MGKGAGAAAALVLATEAPEGAALVKLLRARVQEGDSKMAAPPNSETATVYDALAPPPVALHDYLARWLTYAHPEPSLIVVAAMYVDRVLENGHMQLTSHNIHRMLIAALVTAAKLCEDTPFGNTHYADVGGVSVHELNRIERTFLQDLGFDLYIPPDDFKAAQAHLSGVSNGKERRKVVGGWKVTPVIPTTGAAMLKAADQCCGVVTQLMW